MTPHLFIQSHQDKILVAALIISALITSLPGSFSTEAVYPDGQRYLFNGLLVHDLIRDHAFSSIYQYATEYYRKYPAFNLPYGPPFLAIQFALVFALFGVTFSFIRLLTVAYTIAAALMCRYCIATISGNRWVAFIAAELLLFNSLSLTYSRDIAAEIPVIFFSLAAFYAGYQYIEEEKRGYGLATALLLGFGYLTKQHIVPLGFGLLLYLVFRGKFFLLKKKETFFSAGIIFLLTVPYTILTMRYSTEDLGIKMFPHLSINLLTGYIREAFFCIPLEFILAFFGFIIGIKKRNKLCYLSLAWLLCWYALFTFFYGYYIGEHRYILIIIPALVYPGALTIQKIIGTKKNKYIQAGFFIAIFSYFLWNIVNSPIFFLHGYTEAGNYIGENGKDKNVLFMGTYDGNFLFGVRKVSPNNKAYFFRSDQWLANRLWWGELKNQESVQGESQIINMINKYSIGYIVVETGNPRLEAYPEYRNLQQAIQNSPYFQQVFSVPIRSNYMNASMKQLVIYKNSLLKSNGGQVELPPIKPSAIQNH